MSRYTEQELKSLGKALTLLEWAMLTHSFGGFWLACCGQFLGVLALVATVLYSLAYSHLLIKYQLGFSKEEIENRKPLGFDV